MATTVDLGKVRPVWKGTWSGSTAYEVHDMVKSGLDSYICTTGHTSSGTFSNDSANWDTLATGFSGDASDITSGTIPDARFPSTLPAISGANLTNIAANGGTEGFYAYRNSDQSMTNNTWQLIGWPLTKINLNSNFDTNNSRFVVPSTGTYFFSASIGVNGMNSSSDTCYLRPAVNGVDINDVYARQGGYGGTENQQYMWQGVLSLTQGDYVTMLYHNNVVRSINTASTWFTGFRLT